MANRTALINAFVPSSSMNDPTRFAGRAEEVKALADAIHTDGSVPLIYGQRGLGKSSIAVQLSRIAQGEKTLLEALNAQDWTIPAEKQAIAFYVTCEDSTKDLDGLLRLLSNAIEKLKFEEMQPGRRAKKTKFRMVDKTTKAGVSLKVFNYEQARSYESTIRERDLSNLSPSERLVSLAESLSSTYGQPVLFIIDEIDRLERVDGLSSFLKANSSTILKFALVGIAATVSELLDDHKSLGRQLIPVKIPAMKPPELHSIVAQTEDYLQGAGLLYKFDEEAKVELARIAAGFPWFVHVIGQRMLLNASRDSRLYLSTVDVNDAAKHLASRQMAQTFFDTYQKAVRDSSSREAVLRLFARWPQELIPTSELYPQAVRIGVKGASTYVGHLTRDGCGKVLARAPHQRRALYQFPDQMFKIYVNLRPSIYDGIDDDVNSATSKW